MMLDVAAGAEADAAPGRACLEVLRELLLEILSSTDGRRDRLPSNSTSDNRAPKL